MVRSYDPGHRAAIRSLGVKTAAPKASAVAKAPNQRDGIDEHEVFVGRKLGHRFLQPVALCQHPAAAGLGSKVSEGVLNLTPVSWVRPAHDQSVRFKTLKDVIHRLGRYGFSAGEFRASGPRPLLQTYDDAQLGQVQLFRTGFGQQSPT